MKNDMDSGAIVGGKWQLDSLLGEGGMASVWSATHRNGHRVAIKILHVDAARDDDVRRRFTSEGYLANQIDHPGVVSVLDDDVLDDGRPFLVMELLRGETLRAAWERRDRRMAPAQVVDASRQILAILAAAHAAGVVHRDLKPDNVFVCDDGMVRLLDFGIARVAACDMRTKTGVVLGTPAFMPPEQALGHWERVDARSDLYAVGATAITLLSGEMVHEATTLNELLVAACTKPARTLAQLRPDLPAALRNVFDRAVAFAPADRWQSAEEMAVALADFDQAEPAATVRAPEPIDDEATADLPADHAGPSAPSQPPLAQLLPPTAVLPTPFPAPTPSPGALVAATTTSHPVAHTLKPASPRSPWLLWSLAVATMLVVVAWLAWPTTAAGPDGSASPAAPGAPEATAAGGEGEAWADHAESSDPIVPSAPQQAPTADATVATPTATASAAAQPAPATPPRPHPYKPQPPKVQPPKPGCDSLLDPRCL